jgi:hypothetical protein
VMVCIQNFGHGCLLAQTILEAEDMHLRGGHTVRLLGDGVVARKT